MRTCRDKKKMRDEARKSEGLLVRSPAQSEVTARNKDPDQKQIVAQQHEGVCDVQGYPIHATGVPLSF